MYKILGADQREYGPVTADQIRQWILEGRANGATSVQAEGASEWQPLASFTEFSDALAEQAVRYPSLGAAPASGGAGLESGVQRGAPLDIGQCLGRSWKLFLENAGVLVGATVLFLVIVGAFNQLIALFTKPLMEGLMRGEVAPGPILLMVLWNLPEMALSAVLTGGMYNLLLKLIRGQGAGIADLFAGFTQAFAPLALAGVVIQLLTLLGLLACIVPGVYLSVSWIFTAPLILDRELGFWPAMELSRRTVTGQWWLVFCLLVVVALVSVAGFLACCVGLVAALPVGLGALAYAYEDFFGGPGSTAA